MAIITEKPNDIPSGNDLDNLDLGGDTAPPAYLAFGRSPKEMDDPPGRGETRTFIVKARCKGEHVTERTDGEIRYSRSLEIIACWEEGKPKPPDADEEQPGLFDHGDED